MDNLSDSKQTANTQDSPRRFDEKTAQQLDGNDLRLLDEIRYLSQQQARRSPTGARYCCPSEQYLAGKVGIRRENVSRHVSKLQRLGILQVTYRRKRAGKWQTNLYRIVNFIWWRLNQAMRSLRVGPNRVTPKAHITIPKREKENQNPSAGIREEVKSILERWRQRSAP